MDALERFFNNTEWDDDLGCLFWTKDRSDRYGRIKISGKRILAHRYSYEVFVGPIPAGLVIDHLCGNTKCVTPWHLEPVTQETNVHRHHAKQTHCKHGHEFTEENTYMRGNVRNCRSCHRERNRRYNGGR